MKSILFLCFLFTQCTPLYGEEMIDVVTEVLPPLQWQHDNKMVGPATDFVTKVLNQAQINFNIKAYPWARAYMLAQNKKNILIYSITRTKNREELFRWVGLIVNVDQGERKVEAKVYRIKGNNKVAANSLKELEKYRIAAIRADVNYDIFSVLGFKNIFEVNQKKRIYDLFFLGLTDILITSESTFSKDLEFHGYSFDELELIMTLDYPVFRIYMAMSLKTSDEVFYQLRQAHDEVMKSAVFK